MDNLKRLKEICNNIPYTRHIPKEAEQLAKENNIIIIVGGSDDLMYAYGAECYLTDMCEHGEGWDGCDLTKDASDIELLEESKQLGLKIFWCGEIDSTGEKIKDYSIEEMGSFSYTVADNIKSLDFKVLEDRNSDEVYCTGKIIELPDGFKRY